MTPSRQLCWPGSDSFQTIPSNLTSSRSSALLLASYPQLLEAPRSFCSWPYHSTKFSVPSSSARPCQNNPTRSRMHPKSFCNCPTRAQSKTPAFPQCLAMRQFCCVPLLCREEGPQAKAEHLVTLGLSSSPPSKEHGLSRQLFEV